MVLRWRGRGRGRGIEFTDLSAGSENGVLDALVIPAEVEVFG